MMKQKYRSVNASITVHGAKQHNLKNITVHMPRDALVVVTGPSGSGKSSLVFDTLYAEGQRRYVESLSTYARQFLEQLQKPDVDAIEGLSPAIAIEQRAGSSNPRSIVATSTEIYDYLRLLYAHVGTPHCPHCKKLLKKQTAQLITDRLSKLPIGKRMLILAPIIRGRKGEHQDTLDSLRQQGIARARIDARVQSLEEDIRLTKTIQHTIEAVVDRLVSGQVAHGRLNDSVERALLLGEGVMTVLLEDEGSQDGWREELISEKLSCLECDFSMGEILPRNFSFNSPYGACSRCHGLGSYNVLDETRIVNVEKSLDAGAIPLWKRGPRHLIIYYNHLLKSVAEHYRFSLSTSFKKLSKRIRNILLYGSETEKIRFKFWWAGRWCEKEEAFRGIIPILTQRYHNSNSLSIRTRLHQLIKQDDCPDCEGHRLAPESLAITVQKLGIHQFIQLSIQQALKFIQGLSLSSEEQQIAKDIVREIQERLMFLNNVGLAYLTLNRKSSTLSGGEAQRIRLATQIGSGLMGVLYVLDEPSIGLHPRDNNRLLQTLKELRDKGNTVIVVEHDPETIRTADYLIDLGPGSGARGGNVSFQGSPEAIIDAPFSLTGQYLSKKKNIAIPQKRQTGNGQVLSIHGARENNLKDITVRIPLETFCCVTGVSGSGKSSLVNGTLVRAINRHFKIATESPGRYKRINGLDYINKMIVIDQNPIGRTPRSNPVTYTGAFDSIRQLFSQLPEAKVRGYRPGRFSFNVKGGRCDECMGDGSKKISMQFLPDVYVICRCCNGTRYNQETLSIHYKNKTIADILKMTVDEAFVFFKSIPRLKRILQTLSDVGLGYIHLGQSATTLSGGEAQRIKLSTQLSRPPKGHTLYILDEPTTGLHLDDIKQLLQTLVTLRDKGNTILVIEHNLDVIKTADHLIDMGPEGGDKGGKVIATGTPEEIIQCPQSYTGQFLKNMFL